VSAPAQSADASAQSADADADHAEADENADADADADADENADAADSDITEISSSQRGSGKDKKSKSKRTRKRRAKQNAWSQKEVNAAKAKKRKAAREAAKAAAAADSEHESDSSSAAECDEEEERSTELLFADLDAADQDEPVRMEECAPALPAPFVDSAIRQGMESILAALVGSAAGAEAMQAARVSDLDQQAAYDALAQRLEQQRAQVQPLARQRAGHMDIQRKAEASRKRMADVLEQENEEKRTVTEVRAQVTELQAKLAELQERARGSDAKLAVYATHRDALDVAIRADQEEVNKSAMEIERMEKVESEIPALQAETERAERSLQEAHAAKKRRIDAVANAAVNAATAYAASDTARAFIERLCTEGGGAGSM
jgi:hypothetical protein